MQKCIDLVADAPQLVGHEPPVIVESDPTEMIYGIEPRQGSTVFLHFFAQLSDHLHCSILPMVGHTEIARDEGQLSANLV